MAAVGLAGTEDRRRPLRLVGRVGILLGLQADAVALVVHDALLTGDGTVEEVAGIDLDAGFVGIDLQVDARGLQPLQQEFQRKLMHDNLHPKSSLLKSK